MSITTEAEARFGTEPVAVLETMVRIRAFEMKLAELFKRGRLPGFVHLCVGQEATAAGTCAELGAQDRVATTHRGHGHIIAKGAKPDRMMAEILGRQDGYCRGMGGSMHMMDFDLGILGANGIVAAGIPLATGAGLTDQLLGTGNVNVVFFGDGASNSGVFFESMNLAAIWKLPTIYICENNHYTEWMRAEDITAGRIADRATPMGIPSERVDGNDVVAVRGAVRTAVARARAGDGPTLIEMDTYRWMAHNEGEEVFSGKYRPKEEQDAWRQRDPIARYKAELLDAGVVSQGDLDAIDARAAEEVAAAVEFAEASPLPAPARAYDNLFTTRS